MVRTSNLNFVYYPEPYPIHFPTGQMIQTLLSLRFQYERLFSAVMRAILTRCFEMTVEKTREQEREEKDVKRAATNGNARECIDGIDGT